MRRFFSLTSTLRVMSFPIVVKRFFSVGIFPISPPPRPSIFPDFSARSFSGFLSSHAQLTHFFGLYYAFPSFPDWPIFTLTAHPSLSSARFVWILFRSFSPVYAPILDVRFCCGYRLHFAAPPLREELLAVPLSASSFHESALPGFPLSHLLFLAIPY